MDAVKSGAHATITSISTSSELHCMVWVNTSPLVKTYTLEEFWELPEPQDHSNLELIEGVLYMTPPPGYTHDYAVSRLIRLLSEHLSKNGGRGRYLSRGRQFGPVQTPISNRTCSMS